MNVSFIDVLIARKKDAKNTKTRMIPFDADGSLEKHAFSILSLEETLTCVRSQEENTCSNILVVTYTTNNKPFFQKRQKINIKRKYLKTRSTLRDLTFILFSASALTDFTA